MYDMTDNLWLDGADRAYAQLYVIDDTPWDYRTHWDLYSKGDCYCLEFVTDCLRK